MFDICDVNTWNEASNVSFVWKENTFHNDDTGEDISQKVIVSLVQRMISALPLVISDIDKLQPDSTSKCNTPAFSKNLSRSSVTADFSPKTLHRC